MSGQPCRGAAGRRAAVMVIVLGLITIMLGLALGLTVRVYIAMKSAAPISQNAQAWIMMQSSRLMLNRGVTVPPGGVTIGDLSPGDVPGKELADRLGWARIRPDAGEYNVIACGGSSGSGGKAAPTDGDPLRNAMDVRYLYRMRPDGTVTLQPASADHYASAW